MSTRTSTEGAISGRPAVALVIGSYDPTRCGVAHYCRHLTYELTAKRLPTIVLTAREGLLTSVPLPESRTPIDSWQLSSLDRLARAIAAYDPAIVHIQHAPSSYGGRRAHLILPSILRAHGLRQPVVTTVHEYGAWTIGRHLPGPLGHIADAFGALGERLGRWDRELLTLMTDSDCVVATNPTHHQALRRVLRRSRTDLVQIPIGPNIHPIDGDPAEHRRQVRAALGIADDTPVLVTFGFLHPTKGLETLLAAFARIRDRVPTARLWLIGGHESLSLAGDEATAYRAHLHQRIADEGLTSSVEQTGYLPDHEVSARLFAADVVVCPFNHGVTCKSGTLLAALAHGKPVVATEPPNGPSELRHEQHALLVPPRDPLALAAACERLIGDVGLRDQLADSARTLSAQFSWHEIALRHLRIYVERAPTVLEWPIDSIGSASGVT